VCVGEGGTWGIVESVGKGGHGVYIVCVCVIFDYCIITTLYTYINSSV